MVVRDGENVLRMMRWGLVPPWAEDESIGNRMINARAETLAQKPSFRKPFERRRCLVLADGFYEWKKTGGAKIPYRFVLKGDEPFAFAGLWERWRKPDGVDPHSFVIITTEPNELAREVHDRMPAILAPEKYEQWLDPELRETERLQDLLRPCPARAMACYPVSRLVNDFPDNAAMAYDLACYACVLGDMEGAIESLNKAFDLGGDPIKQRALEEPELQPLWGKGKRRRGGGAHRGRPPPATGQPCLGPLADGQKDLGPGHASVPDLTRASLLGGGFTEIRATESHRPEIERSQADDG